MTGQMAHNIERIRELALQEFTREQIAQKTELSLTYIHKLAWENSIKTQRPRRKAVVVVAGVRERQMSALYKAGHTLQEIGDQFNITRERVRQLLTKHFGMTAPDGGKHVLAEANRVKREAARNAKSMVKWGCGWDQYVQIRSLKKPTRAFASQRKNAHYRGIGFELTLWQWWSIWQQSGHWAERGRGQGYVMCRTNDEGHYAVGNVFIALAVENSSERKGKKSGLPRGVRKNQRCKGYTAFRHYNGKPYRLGTFPTPEIAHAAYLAFVPPQQEAA